MEPEVINAYVRAYLTGIGTRAEQAAEAFDWLDGKQTPNPLELVQPFQPGSDGEKAWNRYKAQVQSLGPRALRFKRDGTIGTVNWGGDNPDGIDAKLEALDLRALASDALKQLFTTGIAAMWAYQPDDGRAPRIQRLGGHVEPLYLEDDPAGEVIGLYQVRAQVGAALRYVIRIYEFNPEDASTGTIYEWRNASAPYAVGNTPTSVIENTSMPRYQFHDRDQDGYPIGEFMQALPIVKSELSEQMKIKRVSDSHAWPLIAAAGDWDIPSDVGTNTILLSSELGSTVQRIEPSSLSGLFTLHDRVLERFRTDLALPINSITTGDFPSGEALEQANAAHVASCKDYAERISKLLTDVVSDYAALLGIDRASAPPVSIGINRDSARVAITEQARADYREGLISFRAAVIAVSQYYPAWADEEVEAFIEAGEQTISLEDFTAGVEGTGDA